MMKATGIVRRIDNLGRIVIPMELRRTLGIEGLNPIEIHVDGDRIILKRYKPSEACALCGEVTPGNMSLHGRTQKLLCKECITSHLKEPK